MDLAMLRQETAAPKSEPTHWAPVVTGNSNTTLHVGDVHGSFQFVANQVLSESQFFSPSLADYSPDRWIDPPAARALLEILFEHRLLILCGSLDDEDKAACARHLARLLSLRLEADQGTTPRVLERWRGKEPQRLEAALQEEGPTILLLPEVTPVQLAGYSPTKLRSFLRLRNGYAILTTDRGRGEWSLSENAVDGEIWQELSWAHYFGAPALRGFLVSRLRDSDRGLPEGLLPDGLEGQRLLPELTLERAIAALRSPQRIIAFSDWLLASAAPPPHDEIERKLATLSGDESSVMQWYGAFDAKEQLLLLGLTLLDGLPEDLLFTALEILVESTWRDLDPQLPQFDYRDLDRFATYFKRFETSTGIVRIQTDIQARRGQILTLAWKRQRRRLLASLPTLTDLIRASVVGAVEGGQPALDDGAPIRKLEVTPEVSRREAAQRILRRSEEGTLQLHQALVESLSLIGLLSIEVVEPYFLELAADPFDEVQELVARALASWRDIGHERDFFDILNHWWSDACRPQEGGSRIARLRRANEDPFAAVRTAVAWAVGYAAGYDRPNHFAPNLYGLLERLVEDRTLKVRSAVMRSTVPRAVAWHFRQLEPLLRNKVLKSDDLIFAVARGAAEACSIRPEDSLSILDSWRAAARAGRLRSDPDHVTSRERLVATVALTYGLIQCDDNRTLLNAATICTNLKSLLMEEAHPFVRSHAFRAIEMQAIRNFSVVSQLMQEMLSFLQLRDRQAAVGLFTRTYLYQRFQMVGGDQTLRVENVTYSVWTKSARPLTEIEATLYGWLLDNSRPIAQQLAVEIFDALGATSLEREELAIPAPKTPSPFQGQDLETLTFRRSRPNVYSLSWLGHLAVYLSAPRKRQVRSVLKALLAQVIVLSRRKPPHGLSSKQASASPGDNASSKVRVEGILQRWSGIPNDATRAVTRLLRVAWRFYRWRWALVCTVCLVVLLLAWQAPAGYRLLRTKLHIAFTSSLRPRASGSEPQFQHSSSGSAGRSLVPPATQSQSGTTP